MVLLKTNLAMFLIVFCAVVTASGSTVKSTVQKQDGVNVESKLAPEPIEISTTSTPSVPITTKVPTTTANPNVTTTTTVNPNVTTTVNPNVTTTTTVKPISTTTTTTTTTVRPTTVIPTSTVLPSTTTSSPNATTTVAPEPSPSRSWDGPSFFGGMVLAFGIVAVGFVGYRFFYLGRGGAYHTL